MKAADSIAVAALNATKALLDGGRMYYFAGPVPPSPGDALDMVADHTQLVEMTVDGDGSTGLTFETATGPTLSKAEAEDWLGLVDFDGADAGGGALTPTFFRMGGPGDDCRGASTSPRIQGTIGGPSSSADIKLGDGNTLTDNGSNQRRLPIFSISQLFLGG